MPRGKLWPELPAQLSVPEWSCLRPRERSLYVHSRLDGNLLWKRYRCSHRALAGLGRWVSVWVLFSQIARELVLQFTAPDLNKPLNLAGRRYRNVRFHPSSAKCFTMCLALGTCFDVVKIRYMPKIPAVSHLYEDPFFKLFDH